MLIPLEITGKAKEEIKNIIATKAQSHRKKTLSALVSLWQKKILLPLRHKAAKKKMLSAFVSLWQFYYFLSDFVSWWLILFFMFVIQEETC